MGWTVRELYEQPHEHVALLYECFDLITKMDTISLFG